MSVHELAMEVQSAILASLIPADPAAAKAKRRLITRHLSEGFALLTQAINPEIVLEIGAHEGGFSLKAKAALPAARIIAVEANPEVHAKHAAALRQVGIEYLQTSISDRAGRMQLNVPIQPKHGEATSMGSILEDANYQNFRSYDVETVTLDQLLGVEAGRPNVAWVDVEGAIGQVLDGAGTTLASCLALYAEVETMQRWVGQRTFAEVVPQLQGYGFVPVLRDVQRSWQFNVIFVRERLLTERHVRRILREIAGRLARSGP